MRRRTARQLAVRQLLCWATTWTSPPEPRQPIPCSPRPGPPPCSLVPSGTSPYSAVQRCSSPCNAAPGSPLGCSTAHCTGKPPTPLYLPSPSPAELSPAHSPFFLLRWVLPSSLLLFSSVPLPSCVQVPHLPSFSLVPRSSTGAKQWSNSSTEATEASNRRSSIKFISSVFNSNCSPSSSLVQSSNQGINLSWLLPLS